jgi:DNA-binding MarR family transcriptional regulator
LKPYHLSEGKFVLVILLRAEPEGLSPNVLAQRAGVTRATITGLLDGLERDALVARESSLADRRMITVQLTAAGQRLATDLGATHTAWIISLMGKLEPDEKAQLGSLLARVWAQTDAGREAIL